MATWDKTPYGWDEVSDDAGTGGTGEEVSQPVSLSPQRKL